MNQPARYITQDQRRTRLQSVETMNASEPARPHLRAAVADIEEAMLHVQNQAHRDLLAKIHTIMAGMAEAAEI